MSDESALRLRVRHVSGFSYAGPAISSYNEARMTPPTLARQRVVDATITIEPTAPQSTYRDYFSTIVTAFDLQEPHGQLEVVAEALVDTYLEGGGGAGLALGDLSRDDQVDRYAEYLAPSERTILDDAVLEAARARVSSRATVRDAVDAVAEAVSDRVAYVRGVTHVSSTAQDVWDQRQGVCQDLSHVTIALLRSLGIPARYVSGYLHPLAGADVGETVVGESHAWIEYFDGVWVGRDPTSAGPIGAHHVVVAKGREYGDVPPLKGIYHGGPSSALGVAVEITREA